jgi:hypothetical protein
MTRARNNERGNAFFIILLGVVLFAALMYTFSKSARHGNENLSKKQTDLGTMELIDAAKRMDQAVDRLFQKGCSENELNFANTAGTSIARNGTIYDYTNASAPPDGSCDVFSANGGGMTPPRLFPAELMADPAPVCAGCVHPQSWWITQETVFGVGTDGGVSGSDLVIWVGRVTKNQCIDINETFGVTNPSGNPPVNPINGNGGTFQGTYIDTSVNDLINDPALAGKYDFCLDWSGSSDWSYIYMHVLHAR